MSIAVADFPQLEVEEVHFDNHLLIHQPELILNGENQTLAFSGIRYQKSLPESVMALELKLANQVYQCFLALKDAEILLADYFDGLNLSDLPELLIEAALEKVLGPFQKSIKEQFSHWLEVKRVFFSEGNDIHYSERNLNATQLVMGEMKCLLYCLMEKSEVRLLTELFGQSRVEKDTTVMLNLQPCFGHVALTRKEIISLEIGDVVFFDTCYFEKQQLRLHIENKPAWLVQLSDESITFIKPWSQEMSQTETPQNVAQESFDLENVNLVMTFEMPAQQMALAEIQSLDKGYTFDLQADPSDAVCVKANGQEVGVGELVSVGGKLGVRLTRMIKG